MRAAEEAANRNQSEPFSYKKRTSDSDDNRPYAWSLHNQHNQVTSSTYVPPQHLTAQAVRELEQERDVLKKQLQFASKTVREANEDGTHLRDNSSFRAAEEERGGYERRLREVDTILRHVVLVKEGEGGKGCISLDSIVTICIDSDEQTYTIMQPGSLSAAKTGKITSVSPIGRALLGRQEGETVEVTTPSGVLSVLVLKIHASA